MRDKKFEALLAIKTQVIEVSVHMLVTKKVFSLCCSTILHRTEMRQPINND